jgi:sugar/nucleoside kinase (ribokinase family)
VRPGETLSSHGFTQRTGGKGANSSVAIAKVVKTFFSNSFFLLLFALTHTKQAGAQVQFLGSVGDDSDGPGVVDVLKGYGVGVDWLKTAKSVAFKSLFYNLKETPAKTTLKPATDSHWSGHDPALVDGP